MHAAALYRNLLRIALSMPDPHRRNLIVYRARTEFEAARSLNEAESQQKLLEMEIYLDNLVYQAEHLNALAKKITLIPVDVRRSSRLATLSDAAESTTPIRRRLIEAINVRTAQKALPKLDRNRFMNGPKPSWIKD